jgi:hypothetical protein
VVAVLLSYLAAEVFGVVSKRELHYGFLGQSNAIRHAAAAGALWQILHRSNNPSCPVDEGATLTYCFARQVRLCRRLPATIERAWAWAVGVESAVV